MSFSVGDRVRTVVPKSHADIGVESKVGTIRYVYSNGQYEVKFDDDLVLDGLHDEEPITVPDIGYKYDNQLEKIANAKISRRIKG